VCPRYPARAGVHVLVAGLIGCSLLIASCTKAPAPPPTSTSASNSDTPTPTPTASQTSASPSTSSSATTSAPTSSAASATSTKPQVAECKKADLKIVVNRGSGAEGHQFADVVFTKTGPGICTITGFPGIQLLLAGKPLGKPAVRANKPTTTITLQTGASATSLLDNNSTCNADNSDEVQVIVPDDTATTDLPLRFRGCTVTVNPVAPS
jgi:Protein of unknown function (DUF4232)